jgi:hypothetical protein
MVMSLSVLSPLRDAVRLAKERVTGSRRLRGREPWPHWPRDDLEVLHVMRLRRHLRKIGWVDSTIDHRPVDGKGEPIPWLCYAAIWMLEPRIKPSFRVFEYGSGNSTLWWAKRAQHVVSCEHNSSWYEKMKDQMPQNVAYIHRELKHGGAYCREINEHPGPFEVIVIDGRDRVNCARQCIGKLAADGVIVWDNTDREHYAEGLEFLAAQGFRRLDFRGMCPIGTFAITTSILYKSDNCLGI